MVNNKRFTLLQFIKKMNTVSTMNFTTDRQAGKHHHIPRLSKPPTPTPPPTPTLSKLVGRFAFCCVLSLFSTLVGGFCFLLYSLSLSLCCTLSFSLLYSFLHTHTCTHTHSHTHTHMKFRLGKSDKALRLSKIMHTASEGWQNWEASFQAHSPVSPSSPWHLHHGKSSSVGRGGEPSSTEELSDCLCTVHLDECFVIPLHGVRYHHA